MPRKNPDDRGGAFYRAGAGQMLEPPEHLDAEAKALWNEIIASKPADRFDPGSACLLEMYVAFAVHARWQLKQLRKAKVTSPEAARLERRVGAMSKTLATLATKLRLTVQARVDRRAGQLDERGEGEVLDDRLIGGSAVRRAN